MSQTIDVAPLRDADRPRLLGARLAAFVGAAPGASGRMRVVLQALDGIGGALAEVELDPAAGEAGLSVRERMLVVPAGTAMLRIELIADTPADGPPVLADDVSLVVWARTSR